MRERKMEKSKKKLMRRETNKEQKKRGSKNTLIHKANPQQINNKVRAKTNPKANTRNKTINNTVTKPSQALTKTNMREKKIPHTGYTESFNRCGS